MFLFGITKFPNQTGFGRTNIDTVNIDTSLLEGPAGTSRPQVFCSVPTRLTYPNLILAATVADLAKSAQIRATEHHKFEP